MKRINNSVILLSLFAGMVYTHAQEKKQISLDEAVQLGIQNSKSLKIDAAKIEEATADLLEAKNRQLPELSVSASYLYLPLKPTIDLKIPGVSTAGGPEVHQVAYGSANVSVPIYSGGRIKYGIQSAKYLVEASKLSSENDKVAIAYNVAQAYNNLFKANQSIKVLEENLSASQKRDETFLKLENNGVIARNDRLKANLQTSNIELQLLEARNNYNIANINMDLLLGLPENTEIDVDQNYLDEYDNVKPVDFYLNEARESRKDLQAIDQQRKAAALGTKSAKAENLPSIAFTGGYVAADIPNFLTIYNAVNVGVGVSYNLSNLWKENSSLKKSKAREMQLSATNELLTDRLCQGIGGGALLVTSQTIITESYPVEKRSMAQAIYGLGVIIGPTLGPPLGGYIVDNFSWPYIFYINIPLGIAATLMTLQFVRSPKFSEKRKASDVDWLGIMLLALTVGSLQFILERGHEEDWFESGMIVTFTTTAVLGFILFLWRELTCKYPIVELRVLKNGNLRIGTVMSFVLGFGLYGSTFIVPLYTQSVLGWTALQSGALMIPAALTTAFMMPIIGRLLTKGVKQQILVSLGLLIFFIYSFWGYKILTPDTSKEAFFWMLIVRGMGLGLLFIPITSLSLSTLKGQEIGQGAAFTGMMRQLGGSFGIAAITTFIANAGQKYRMNLISHLDGDSLDVQQRLAGLKANFIAKGMTPDHAMNAAYKVMDMTVTKQATVLSYMDVFLYLGVVFLICIPFILFIKERKSKEKIDLSEAMH